MKPLILVAYRNRQVHLECFRLYMTKIFPHMNICVIEQGDNEKWNKGLLFNVGYKEMSANYDYIILHDVDFIPNANVDYSFCQIPTLLSTECSQFNYGYCYETFFGGVVGIRKDHYELVNGFSNQFTGYGGEDDLLYRSFVQKGITPTKRLGNRFECFEHPRPKIEADYKHNLQVLEKGRDFTEGLSTVKYIIVNKYQSGNYTHLKIITNG